MSAVKVIYYREKFTTEKQNTQTLSPAHSQPDSFWKYQNICKRKKNNLSTQPHFPFKKM